jgi:hypothetical protein
MALLRKVSVPLRGISNERFLDQVIEYIFSLVSVPLRGIRDERVVQETGGNYRVKGFPSPCGE